MYGNVVHAVVYQIGANRRVQIHLKRNLQLGAHTVNARDEHGVEVLGFVDRKKAAKSANLAQYAPGERLMGQILDSLFRPVGTANIDACIGVCDGRRTGRRSLGHS